MDPLEPRDRALVTEIVYGALRWRGTLDHVLSSVSARAWESVDPELQIVLRTSVYQLWRMDRIPDHAVVNDAVALARLHFRRGAEKFVNALLRKLTALRPWQSEDWQTQLPPWVRASLPPWLWERWGARFGQDVALSYALSLNQPPQQAVRPIDGASPIPPHFRASDIAPNAYVARREDEAAPSGSFAVQDEASQLVPHLLAPLTGGQIWDACAAPGGKSAILRGICGRDGWIVSSDISLKRGPLLRETVAAVAGARSDIVIADAAAPPFRRGFDAVLVDAPCSGLGTLRRNPEIKWRLRPEQLARFGGAQLRILLSAAQLVRPRGRLLYSTCSTEPEENERVLEDFLKRNPEFQLIPPASPGGIGSWTGADSMVRTYPSERFWDGFFAALMVRDS
jgi:16S rRNA (cytosine967-C5)-methyltransferase